MDKNELLERHHNAFINLESPRDFFIGMADYFEFADSVPEFEKILDDLLAQGKGKWKELDILGERMIKVLDGIKKRVDVYVAKNQLKNEQVLEPLKEYSQWKNGEILGNVGVPLSLACCITEAIREITNLPEHTSFASQFAEIADVSQWPLIARLLSFKEYEDYVEFKSELERERELTLWGQAEQLSQLYDALKRGRTEYKKLSESHNIKPSTELSWKMMNYGIIVGEWIDIEEGKQGNVYLFNVKKVRPWLMRLHTFMLSNSTASNSIAKAINTTDPIIIKKIVFKEKDAMIEINGGKKIISFKDRKGKNGNEETKFYKIIYHLWEFRDEIGKNGDILKKGEWVTIDNLAIGANSTNGATTKNISRLRDTFKSEIVPIEITSSNNGRYKLVIYFN